MNRFSGAVFFVVTAFFIVLVVLTPNDTVDNFGFAVHPLYSGYALPFAYSGVNTFLQFSDVSSSVSRSFDVSDTVIYNRGYVSYDGQSWQPFTLSTTNAVSGAWIYTKGTASVSFTPAQLRMSLSRNVSNNTYVVIYSCSRINNAWDCHDGWQIIKFNAKINPTTIPTPVPISSTGKTYYIAPSPSGNDDTGNGSIIKPWFSLNKAWSYVSAGDIIYIRGGTYSYTDQQTLTSKSGTSGNYITITGYPNESPIFDFTNFRENGGDFSGIRIADVSYVYFNKFRITNIKQPRFPTHAYRGIWLRENVHDCTFEQVETNNIGGWGVALATNINDILFLNCDSHHNQDPYSAEEPGNPSPGVNYGGSDGWQMGNGGVNNIIFRGCRSWANSDDGWDTRVCPGLIIWENSWSFWNGYIPETITTPSERRRGENGLDGSWIHGGDGEGFKVAGEGSGVSKIIRNSLAFENWLAGFHPSPDGSPYGTTQIYNSVAYANWEGFSCDYANPSTLRNDISYYNLNDWKYASASSHSYNSDDVTTVTNADFLSLDSSCMDDARKSDGSLPDCNFLHLNSTSDLISKGVHIDGLTTDGAGKSWNNPPSLGAFEYP